MADTEITAMEIFDKFSSALGMVSTVEGLLGGSPSSASEIAQAVAAEVRAVFLEELTNQDVKDAAAKLDTLRTFLYSDYAAALKSANRHNPPDYPYLWDYLNDTAVSPSLPPVTDSYNKIVSSLKPGAPPLSQRDVCQILTVSLGLAIHICLVERERGTVATALAAMPDGTVKDKSKEELSDWADTSFQVMQTTAQEALKILAPRVMQIINNRIMGVVYEEYKHESEGYPQGTTHAYSASIREPIFTDLGQPDVLYAWLRDGQGHPNYRREVAPIWAPYHRVLWDGQDDDWQQLQNAVSAYRFNDADAYRTNSHDFRVFVGRDGANDAASFVAESMPNMRAFGKWSRQARNLLIALDLLARGLEGTAEDNWLGCAKCGLLYHGAHPGRCFGGGVHSSGVLDAGQGFGQNFIVQRLNEPLDEKMPTSDAIYLKVPGVPNTLRFLARCSKCQVLHFMPSNNSSHCAGGGTHEAAPGGMLTRPDGTQYADTGHRFVCTGDVPAQLGLSTVKTDWSICVVCFSLYHPNINGRCFGGSPHAGAGTISSVWLPSLSRSPNAELQARMPPFKAQPPDGWPR